MGRPVGQAGGHVEGLTGPVHQVIDDDAHHMGETLAAVLRVPGRGGPAVFAVQPEGRLERGGAADLAVFQNHPPFFPDLLEGSDLRPGKFQGLFDQQVQGFLVEFPVAVQLAEAAVIQLMF